MSLSLSLTIGDIKEDTDCRIVQSGASSPSARILERRVTDISTDSRKIQTGNLFVAISGDRFDGHDYIGQAMQHGAAAALVSQDWVEASDEGSRDSAILLAVPDVLSAFQKLAGSYRERLRTKVIGVTGSSGKTTTKDMVAAVFSTQHSVLKTPGNLNSQLGLPQVIFQIQQHHEFAVLEMGMNHPGEISRLAKMARPEVGLITNVGPVHLEFLESVEGVASAKGELLDFLHEKDLAVLNADDPLVMGQRLRTRGRLITYGLGQYADVRAREMRSDMTGSVFVLDDGTEFRLNILGEHHVMNALAAIAVGMDYGIPIDDIREALAAVKLGDMRMEVQSIGGITLINDAYNANPDSVRVALSTLTAAQGEGRRIAVLGDMLELGESTVDAHREIGAVAAGCDVLVAVGERAHDLASGARESGMNPENVHECGATHDAGCLLPGLIRDGDMILVKGSRGMKMEDIVADLASAAESEAV